MAEANWAESRELKKKYSSLSFPFPFITVGWRTFAFSLIFPIDCYCHWSSWSDGQTTFEALKLLIYPKCLLSSALGLGSESETEREAGNYTLPIEDLNGCPNGQKIDKIKEMSHSFNVRQMPSKQMVGGANCNFKFFVLSISVIFLKIFFVTFLFNRLFSRPQLLDCLFQLQIDEVCSKRNSWWFLSVPFF